MTGQDWARSIERHLAALNEHFAGHARALAAVGAEPGLARVGDLDLAPEVAALAKRLRERLAVNELQAILDGEPAGETVLRYRTTDFAAVQALRSAGQKPRVLSAGAVVVAPEQRALVLHHRALGSASYGGCLHTLGGAYTPRAHGLPGDASLAAGLLREIEEESNDRLAPGRWPAAMVEETTTGFVQYVALGLLTHATETEETHEGTTCRVGFDALPRELLRAKGWVPSGKLQVLLWLAAGTPGCEGARFGGMTGDELLAAVLARSARDYDLPVMRIW